ncbi:MAG: hypothetical protein LBJ25_07715 [Candidatus Margulisbacteria bacterium]|jgi:hypothetical protein|nr:hypothetical protein [Candidatus Margulisiibacteriota bacterium]
MAGGSIEDSVIAKLKLDELQPGEKPAALLAYFDSVITGKIRTSPVELKAVLSLLCSCQSLDQKREAVTYLNTHQISIDHFFSDNMQRFDRFEFKPYFLRLKGIEPGREFAVPVNARRNFENIQPLNTRLYKDLLESDQQALRLKRDALQKVDLQAVAARRAEESRKITEAFNQLQQRVDKSLQSGAATKEQILAKLRFVEELYLPELQLRHNEPALQRLAGLLLVDAEPAADRALPAVEEVFNSLKMPQKQREAFCAALAKKI